MEEHRTEQSVEELLEQGEQAAKLQDADRVATDGTRPQPSDREPRGSTHSRHHRNYNRYSAEREENDERRARKSRELGDDFGPRTPSDVGSANESVRSSRRRSRSPRGGHHYSSPRDYRDRDSHYRGNDDRYYRPSGRSRHDDRGRRPSGRDRDRRDRDDRESHRNYDYRDDHRYRPEPDRRGRRRSSPAPERNTPELTADEHDKRTVFVQQLANRLKTKELKAFFNRVGTVIEAQIVTDRISGRSKGVGYVEFEDEESVPKAIALTGQQLCGIPVIVQLTEAEKNRQAARNSEGTHATQSNGVPFHRLYVGNIHFSVTEDDLRLVFLPFGDLEFVQLQKDDNGRSKGYGFVQYVRPADAKSALEGMNGFEIAGRPIRVGLGNDKFTPESTKNLLQNFGGSAKPGQQEQSGGRGPRAGAGMNFDRAGARDAERAGGASALDDIDVAGLNVNAYNRSDLMYKLANRAGGDEPVVAMTQPRMVDTPETQPSRCIMISNMFSEEETTVSGWKKELEEDVREECNLTYGPVVHVGVAPSSDDGEVYVKFKALDGSKAAYLALNGRHFNGRIISAQYVVEAVYTAIFPKASTV